MLMSAAGASAQEIDDRVRPGMSVWVLDDLGDRHRGRVESVSRDLIRLSRFGTIEAIPAENILRIEQPQRIGNGGAIGLYAGMAVGFYAGITSSGNALTRVLATSATAYSGALVGAGIGLCIDAFIHRPRTLYERPPIVRIGVAPIANSRSAGGVVTVTW
jgi:hypothetical protein